MIWEAEPGTTLYMAMPSLPATWTCISSPSHQSIASVRGFSVSSPATTKMWTLEVHLHFRHPPKHLYYQDSAKIELR